MRLVEPKVRQIAVWVLFWLLVAVGALLVVVREIQPYFQNVGLGTPPTAEEIEQWPEYAAMRADLEALLQKKFPPGSAAKDISVSREAARDLTLVTSYVFYVSAERKKEQPGQTHFDVKPGKVTLLPARAFGLFAVVGAIILIPVLFKSSDGLRQESGFLQATARALQGPNAETLPAALAHETLLASLRLRRLENLASRLASAGVLVVLLGACASWGLLPFWLSSSEPFDFAVLTRPVSVFFGFSVFGAFLLRQARSTMEDVKYFNSIRSKSVYWLASLAQMPESARWRDPEKIIESMLKEATSTPDRTGTDVLESLDPSSLVKSLRDLGPGKG